MNDEQILDKLKKSSRSPLKSPRRVVPEANLFKELDLDSIDASIGDQAATTDGKRIKPEDFKTVRTVGDVISTGQATDGRLTSIVRLLFDPATRCD
jgi:acyl carrier protein